MSKPNLEQSRYKRNAVRNSAKETYKLLTSLSEGAIKQKSSETGQDKSPHALDFIEYTVIAMSAKSAGKTRLVGSRFIRQAAIPIGVGISNGRQDLKAPPLGNVLVPPDSVARATDDRPFCSHDLPQPSPTTDTNLPPSTFHLRSRFTSRPHLLVSRAVAVRFVFPSFRTRNEKKRCTHVVLSSNQRYFRFFFLPSYLACTVGHESVRSFANKLRVLYETFSSFIRTIMTLDYLDCIGMYVLVHLKQIEKDV